MKIIIITGQTGTGKTSYALKLAVKYNGELINSDSRQIYQKLDIITGKDYPKDRKIRLYDIVDPKFYFSSYEYVQEAIPLIKQLLMKNKTPIIVGGSYLYLKHLLYDIDTENIPPDWQLRKDLENKTIPELQLALKSINNEALKQLNNSDINNPQRLIRKIEIAKVNNVPPAIDPGKITLGKKLGIDNLDIQFIGFRFIDKELLHKKIIKRVEERLKNGAIGEVKRLLTDGYTENDPGMKTIGYPQIIKYLKGETTQEEAIKQWTFKEFQYAKRQYIFMKKDSNISWQFV